MASTKQVVSRLEDGGLASLATLIVDWMMERPVGQLVEPRWMAEQVVVALEAVSSGPQTEQWLNKRIAELREQVPEGTTGDRVPREVSDPLLDVVGKTYLPDRALVGRLLDHDAVRRLFKDVLVGAIEGFVRRLRLPPGSQERASRRLGKLRALGEKALQDSVLGGLSHELERQAEQRIREFVEGAIHAVIEEVGDHLCAPEHADRYASYRAYLVQSVLDTELQVIAGEIDKLHPDDLVATGAATARALAGRDGFVEEVEAVIAAVIEAAEGRSMRDYLTEAGVKESWRDDVEAMLVQRGLEIVRTPEFTVWLDDLLA